MALRYCFENPIKTLQISRTHDLAVVDTEGHEKTVREAVSRGVWVYGYLNVGGVGKNKNTVIYTQCYTKRSVRFGY